MNNKGVSGWKSQCRLPDTFLYDFITGKYDLNTIVDLTSQQIYARLLQ